MSARVDTSTAETLLRTLLLPLYPDDVRADLATARKTDANPAQNPRIAAALDEIADVFTKMADVVLGQSLSLDRTDASVHRLGAAITREARDRMLREPGPDGAPVLAHFLLHAAIYVGACVVREHGGTWQIRRPLWESMVRLVSRAGEGDLALLSWLCRSLCDEEIDRQTLGDRYRMHVEVPTTKPEDLPPIAPPDRRLPRLKKPKYDTLHKYIKAHLPELRDLGADFPSPERFVDLQFQWLDFVLVGGGRMLVMHGPTDAGVHVFWLDIGGFAKSAYYPADAFPEHKVEVNGETLRVIVPLLGKTVFHEVLWWGV
jgi:hypothetical protein